MKNYILTSMWRKPIFRFCMSIVVLSFVVTIATGCQTGVDNDIEITPQLIEALKKYDRCFEFHDGLAAVIKDGKYGYINGKGEEVIPVQYEFHDISDSAEGYEELTIRNFSDGMVAVAKFTIDDELGIPIPKWGFMDKKGNIIIPFQYANVGDFSEGICAVDEGAYIDKEGNLIFTKDNSLTNDFHSGLALIKNWKDYSYIFVDKKGNDVIDCSFYSRVEDFHDGLAYVEKKDDEGNITYKGFIDTKGKEVIDCTEYDNVNSFNDGLASVCKNEKWGFINQKGLLVIPCEYSGEYDWGSGESTFKNYFSEGLCQVDSFFIDKNNDVVLRVSNGHLLSNFSNGLSCSALCGGDLILYGYMDKNGNTTFSEDDYKTINQNKKEVEELYKIREQEEKERNRRKEQERKSNAINATKANVRFRSSADVHRWISPSKTFYGGGAYFKGTIELRSIDREVFVYFNGIKFSKLYNRGNEYVSNDIKGNYARFFLMDDKKAYPFVIHLGDGSSDKPYVYFETVKTEHFMADLNPLYANDDGWEWYEPDIQNGKAVIIWHVDEEEEPMPLRYTLQ